MLHASFQDALLEAGCDEAGRGCLAGPVFAAAVILPRGFQHPALQDSKQLTAAQRLEARNIILRYALSWSVAQMDHTEIDRVNILQASFRAMHKALDGLNLIPEFVIVDGNRFIPYRQIPHQTIVGGDGLYASIAAAGILAKTSRDAFMETLHLSHPVYAWDRNKGYGTAAHLEAIRRYGLSPYHRQSFRNPATHSDNS